jgi:diguanylate cyclase (GGDEF)-like protein
LPGIRNPLSLRLVPLMLVIAAGLLSLTFSAAVATRHWFVLPKLRQIEAESDHKDLRRVLLAIDAKKLQLVTLAYKNAIWDGMYSFAEKPVGSVFNSSSYNSDYFNKSFFDSSFPLDTLTNFNIDMVALLDRNNRIIEQRVIDEAQDRFIEKPIPLTELSPYLIDLTKVRPSAPIFDSGFVETPDGPMIFAVVSVMRSDSNSDADANLLLATYFDEDLRNEIEENAQISVTFATLTALDKTAKPASEDAVYRDHHNQLIWLLRDNRGKPALKLILTLPQRSNALDLWALPLAVSFITGLFGAIVTLVLLQRLLVRPLLGIGKYLREVRQNDDYTKRLDSKLRNELGELSRDIDALVQHVDVQQQQLQKQTNEMQALSFQDGLTGLDNRRRFDQALTDNWVHAQRAQTPLALIMLDVDYFKNYNDHYGHQQGDEALKQLAAIIRHVVVRQSDIAARYGGEEFAILLPDTTEANARKIAERIQQELVDAAIPHTHSTVARTLTVSIGIAAITPGPTQNSRELVQHADAALYSAKGAGRNRIESASQMMV